SAPFAARGHASRSWGHRRAGPFPPRARHEGGARPVSPESGRKIGPCKGPPRAITVVPISEAGRSPSMLVTLDGRGRLADQIYQSIRRAILEGALRSGSRLPPTRVLAAEVGAARNTVLLAYEHLLAEGYAVGRVGSGTYVAASLPETPLTPARHLV